MAATTLFQDEFDDFVGSGDHEVFLGDLDFSALLREQIETDPTFSGWLLPSDIDTALGLAAAPAHPSLAADSTPPPIRLAPSPRPSNEARPPAPPRHEMEGSGAGPLLAAHPAPLPENPYASHATFRMTAALDAAENRNHAADLDFLPPLEPTLTGDTLDDEPPTNHVQARDGVSEEEQQQQVSPTSTNAAIAANTLANLTAQPLAINTDLSPHTNAGGEFVSPFKDYFFDEPLELHGNSAEDLGLLHETFEDGEQEHMIAFAKLSFPDGDYYVKETKVTLGRNKEYFYRYAAQQRQEKVMAEYAQEPSRPSQPDDAQDPSSKSSHSLEGRPARALPSNFSEQGGIASYTEPAQNEPPMRRTRRKRSRYISQSSSTISVAPANLHAKPDDLYGDATVDEAGDAFVPVHPMDPADIKKISQKHLQIAFDSEQEAWFLTVLGRFALYNDQRLNKDDVVELENLDRIKVFSLEIIFKLPNDEGQEDSPGPSCGPFADDVSSAPRTSPIRRLSTAMDVEDSEDEPEIVPEKTQKKQKIKLSLGKKKGKKGAQDKVADKPAGKEKEKSIESPEIVKKPEKGKKPKAAAKESAESSKDAQVEQKEKEPTSPPQPVNLEGTGLEGLAPAELPQKRKGPGRPPKNGLVSKRDLSFVNRKKKEYEKRGLQVPPFDVLLQQVREENKIRDAQQKAQANGQPMPDMPVMQSIETDAAMPAVKAEGDAAGPSTMDGVQKTSATLTDAPRKVSPKSKQPAQPARSPSPMPPESAFTEEELKKPPGTYVHQLDIILRSIKQGDLPDIYDKMCKTWPYYKYRAGTVGWQSSVRHNLLQNPRFKEIARSGKGRLWAINYDVPLEKEKKRRGTPPQRAPMPQMQNGQWPPGTQMGGLPYGQPGYGAYGQHGGAYASPYAPGTAPPYAGASGPPNEMPQHAGYQHPHAATPGAHSAAYPPYPPPNQPPHTQLGTSQPFSQHRMPAPPTQFQGIVNEIMDFRSQYLQQFPQDSEVFKQQSELFSRCTTSISNQFHGTGEAMAVQSEDERRVHARLTEIFDRFEHLKSVAAAAAGGLQAHGQGSAPAGGAGCGTGATTVGSASASAIAEQRREEVGGGQAGARAAQPAALAASPVPAGGGSQQPRPAAATPVPAAASVPPAPVTEPAATQAAAVGNPGNTAPQLPLAPASEQPGPTPAPAPTTASSASDALPSGTKRLAKDDEADVGVGQDAKRIRT